jgi:AbrB family looped-hinge helix DNA binding protein
LEREEILISKSKCYGSATIGERGQVVIPAEARHELGLEPGEKLLVFGRRAQGIVLMVKADRVADLITKTSEWLGQLKESVERETPDE